MAQNNSFQKLHFVKVFRTETKISKTVELQTSAWIDKVWVELNRMPCKVFLPNIGHLALVVDALKKFAPSSESLR